ncbi:MAG: HAMP domain-containing sensor histidine kinase [Lachnospiraceae bacterium]|nr:HAMP domain-containing sensor histidine kinase [Lachnospiraceae bacterium]
MKLSKKITISFLIIIVVPIFLMSMLFGGAAWLQAGSIREKYGIDVMHLNGEAKTALLYLIFCMIVVLVMTAVLLSLWLAHGISTPIQKLIRATRSIGEGNMDFDLQPESNVIEICELYRAFEDMRSKLIEANEEKVEFDRQNQELISNISHDLRTPITAVKGYCEGLMDGVADTPEKRERYIRTIYSKAIDMDRLINELSFYSKITTNRIPYTFNKVNVRGFFDDAAAEFRDDLESKGFRFDYTNSVPEPVLMIADVERIMRVLHNLVGNAVKYNDKEQKQISLAVRLEGDEIRVAVQDNGRGIAAKDLGNVFDRFYRADSSRNSTKGGSGIGLSIVKKIVEDHNGRVWAVSREGEGTTMYFVLRRYMEEA